MSGRARGRLTGGLAARALAVLALTALACATPGGAPEPAAAPTAVTAPTPPAGPSPAPAPGQRPGEPASAAVPAPAAPVPEAAPSAPPPPAPADTPPLPPASAAPAAPEESALPPPLPPPVPPPAATDLSDPLELLWGHRLSFAAGGEPLVTIRLMEGQEAIAFRPRAAARVLLRGGGVVELSAGARLTVRARSTAPARLAWWPLLAEAPGSNAALLEAERQRLLSRGVAVRTRVVGAVYGIAGHVVDSRRLLLVADADGTEAGAREALERLRVAHGVRGTLHAEVADPPSGRLELLADGGAPLGEADTVLTLEVAGDAGFMVEAVEHERGSSRVGHEDRTYRGRLFVTLDAGGRLAAIHGVPLEELLRGLVPSEMPGGSPLEALKAQAVTARSNVLAQLGARHANDPFMLCAEVHCQAYRGDGARTPRSDEAVRATRGEALFAQSDRRLVDAVYSALCGGHGEDNDQVWGNAPSSSLRGRPDLPPDEAARWQDLSAEPRLRAFLAARPRAWCARAPGRPDRYRWERRLSAARLDALAAPLGVGRVRSLTPLARGASGRIRVLRVAGDAGSADVGPELRIRRLLGDLPSSMFVVERDGTDWIVKGGGWGHGAGMCQWGAVGRATAGQGYREILRAYYSGAEVVPIY